MTMKNKQRFTLVYAAPGFFRKRRDGKEKEIEPPEEPEYPACYDEEPEMKREPEEFVCVYASPEWFENRERERREAEEFKDVYASPEWFAGKGSRSPKRTSPLQKSPNPLDPQGRASPCSARCTPLRRGSRRRKGPLCSRRSTPVPACRRASASR